MTAKKTSATEKNVADNSNLPPLSDAEIDAARKEGAKEDVKEAAKESHRYLTDGQLPGDPPARQWHGSDDIMQFEPILGEGIEAFQERIAEKHPNPLPEEKVYGLLKLERNGQNRTPYVKALMKRLDITKEELPAGGPDYTNDVTPVSKL